MSWWKYVGGLSPSPAAIPNLANPSGLAARLLRTRPARRGWAEAAVIVGAGAAGLVGLLVWRLRRTRMGAARAMPPRTPARAAQPLPQARQATDLPAVHLHFHGIAAEDVAAILARH
jgi:hypothetical protein